MKYSGFIGIFLLSIVIMAATVPQPASALVPVAAAPIAIVIYVGVATAPIIVNMASAQFSLFLNNLAIYQPRVPTLGELSGIDIKINPDNPVETAKKLNDAKDAADAANKLVEIIKNANITKTTNYYTSSNLNDPIYLYQHGERYLPGKFIFVRTVTETQGGMTTEWLEWARNPEETISRTPLSITINLNSSTATLSMKSGWNQISSPIASGIDLSTIEESCTVLPYENKKLWAWDAQKASWINPDRIEPLQGYWIYAANECNVPLSGTSATFTNLQLYNGWNMISASGSISALAGTCAGYIANNWIWNWDASDSKWTHPDSMQLNKGYWVYVDQDCKLRG